MKALIYYVINVGVVGDDNIIYADMFIINTDFHSSCSLMTYNISIQHIDSAGVGARLHQEADGLCLYQERVELAGRPHAREQEEEAGGC